ncbi:hydrocephalus-inducing protein-like isoform X2 [Zonotrichia leucophrys gambelii]|uniref:hydrocephalus-inducing protein-like isoform X2 n=1 Tax=Zonotrichia leucophrys gambelii TaxID=257770 RepID=UPI00313FE56E
MASGLPKKTPTPRLLSREGLKPNALLPSKFQREKFLSRKKEASTGGSILPRIGPFLDRSETRPKLPSAAPKQSWFGVSPPELVFQNFVAREVSEMVLSLMNKDKFLHVVKVSMESSPYFQLVSSSDAYRAVPPGASAPVRIRFTPSKNKDYCHELVCLTARERIVVPIRAIGARAVLDFPAQLDFSKCPVKVSTQQTLLVRNVGARAARYQLSTQRGSVTAPSLHFDLAELDFGDISFGFPYTQRCRLTNSSAVPLTFQLRMSDDGTQPAVDSVDQIRRDTDPAWSKGIHFYVEPREFSINPSQGTILPQGHQDIEVTLCSNTVMEFYRRLLVDLEGIGKGVAALIITAREHNYGAQDGWQKSPQAQGWQSLAGSQHHSLCFQYPATARCAAARREPAGLLHLLWPAHHHLQCPGAVPHGGRLHLRGAGAQGGLTCQLLPEPPGDQLWLSGPSQGQVSQPSVGSCSAMGYCPCRASLLQGL